MIERAHCLAEIDTAITAHRQGNAAFGLMLLRLQRHGQFNLSLDTAAVQAAATRIDSLLRPDDRIVQVGACDFMILLNGLRSPLHATLATNRIINAFREAVDDGGQDTLLDARAGVALFPEHGDAATGIWRAAELALEESQADQQGYRIAGRSTATDAIDYNELREAITNNALQVFFQGVWDLRSLRLAAVESLARWHSPRLGWVSPEHFVRYAERAGLIEDLTRWSIHASLREIAQARGAGIALPLAINLSARVLHISGLVEQILDALALWDIAPETVLVEVTESAVMADAAHSARVLSRLREAGIGIAIDDFGTGQSSFDYLRQFPVTELKIDRRFVVDVIRESRTARLVSAMVELAHTLGSIAVAEGIEDQRTAIMLREIGCDRGQGHYFGAALPAQEMLQRCIGEPAEWSAIGASAATGAQQHF